MRFRLLATGAAFLGLLCGHAQAALQPVVANMAFDTPLTITKTNDIDFGLVAAAHAGTYIIAPNGAVQAQNGGHILGGAQQPGRLTIAGSATQTVGISVANYRVDGGVMPSAATCQYGDGAAALCNLGSQAAPGTGKPLVIGVTVAVDGTQKRGDHAAPSFDLIVNYD